MTPRMSPSELACFKSFLSASSNYLEFGCGGSTYLASQMVPGRIVAIDSSRDWIEKVQIACNDGGAVVQPRMIHVDIGATGDWGFPTDNSTMDRWPLYYEKPWELPECYDTDLYLVDGRFRVASFMSALLNCRPDCVILLHDFASRPEYHIVREVAREVSRAEDISAFVPAGANRRRVVEILTQYRFAAV
jgi:hypothetical protein